MNTAEKLKRILNDPVLWIECFCKIVDKRGFTVPFKLNPQQKYLIHNIEKFNIVLKSRQLGITSIAAAYSLYLAHSNPNTTCLLMSYSIDSATGIFEKLKQLYYSLPNAIRVNDIANNKKELKLENGSRIIVCTCGNKDVARGLTIRFCHISETAFCNESIEKQILAIEQALIPNGKIILESTANGLNYFSEIWGRAERKESLYKPFFFSWIDDKRMFADEYKDYTERYLNRHDSLPSIEELDSTEQELCKQGATIEQLCWRRLKIANSNEESFKQEFPSNPVEAFITSGNSVFDAEKVYARLQHLNESPPVQKPPKLFPASLKPYFCKELLLWQKPKVGNRYFAGVDTAEGLGGKKDYSVIEIFNEDGFQCAEFRSNKIKPFQFATIVNDIGKYFNRALLVIEKASAGHTICSKLKEDFFYPNLYRYKEYDARGRAKKRVGFSTNTKTKPLIINRFVEMFETGQLCVNSEYLLKEMKMFVFDNGKTGAVAGSHDDTIMATALSLEGLASGIFYL